MNRRAALRGNLELKPLSIHEDAIKLLGRYGLQPQPSDNNEYLLDIFIERLQRKREEHADVYYNTDPEEYLDPVSLEALRLLNEAPKFRLSDALEIYLKRHKKSNNKKFRLYTERVWKKLI